MPRPARSASPMAAVRAPRRQKARPGGRDRDRPARNAAESPIAWLFSRRDAGERVRRALAAVGPELSGILIDVCCHLKGLEEAEKRAGWPQRSSKIMLGAALAALARHYGFAPAAVPSSTRVRHWGADGYRPAIDGDCESAPEN